jgi:hypothetical protein
MRFGDAAEPKRSDSMPVAPDISEISQTNEEALKFIEDFAKLNIDVIRRELGSPALEIVKAEKVLALDWSDPILLMESGLSPDLINGEVRAGNKYLHIDLASSGSAEEAVKVFLGYTGLSSKQQRSLFPVLHGQPPRRREILREEVSRLNAWLDWVRRDSFDPTAFITYQRSIGIHGGGQNRTGAIGAIGAAIAFIDAIRQIDGSAIIDHVGSLPPNNVRAPSEIFDWIEKSKNPTVKALLLRNGRALVFASSKDANIFMPLGGAFVDARDAMSRFNKVSKNEAQRKQVIHEFAVGEVKTATDLSNLHERLGLASRETQTELRTDRFLMMAVLNKEILSGGVQRRVMNNRDLTRFSHIFNLHHCWGWDGGRVRHPDHWNYFVSNVRTWCGL